MGYRLLTSSLEWGRFGENRRVRVWALFLAMVLSGLSSNFSGVGTAFQVAEMGILFSWDEYFQEAVEGQLCQIQSAHPAL